MSPEPSSPPADTAALPPSAPQQWEAVPTHSRRPLLIGAIIALLLLVLGLSVGAFFLLRRSAEPTTAPPTSALPQAAEGDANIAPEESPTGAPTLIASPPPGDATTPVIDISGALLPKDKINLAVTVGYRRSDTFTLTINDVARTYEEPTIALYQPLGSEPHSIIRLLSAAGNPLFESRFTISTEVIAEDFSAPAVQNAPQPVDESTSYLVLPVTATDAPAKVQILNSGGQLVTERAITFNNVPLRQPPAISPGPSARATTGMFWAAIRAALGIRDAQAQTPSAGLPKLAKPTITPNGGTHVQASRIVTINMPNGLPGGATIYYTQDGSDPTEQSPIYSGPLTITRTTTVKARAFGAAFTPSDIATATITLKLAKPNITPPDGSQFTTSPVNVTITMPPGAPSGVTIRYTLDGSEPTAQSLFYSGPFNITETKTVKARAFKDGFLASDVATAKIKICVPCFFVAVVGDRDADTASAIQGVTAMANGISPWNKYADKIMVIPIENSADLGCRLTPIEGQDRSIVTCPYEDRIHQSLSSILWHAAVVVAPSDCNCGTVTRMGNRITGVGTGVDDYTIAHELGHSIGKLVDEYTYLYGYSGASGGPNCFTSQNECLAKRQQFPDLECQPGCRSTGQFRPYTLMMHTFGSRVMGSFDACLTEVEVTRNLGLPAPPNCENPDLPPDPSPAPGQETSYWGWRR